MAVTLEEARLNTQDMISLAIIDELRRYSWLLDQITFDDCVNPAGGGATLTYGYTRLTQTRGAAFRAYNTEYGPPEQARRERHTVDLHPLGGTYELDRVLAHLGPAATDEAAFQLSELMKAVRNTFQTEIIRGDTAANGTQADGEPLGFDGLDKALTGSTTEAGADTTTDWAGVSTEADAHKAIDGLEELLGLLDGQPGALMTNRYGALKIKAVARRAGYYSRAEDALGRSVESFAGVPIVDLGDTNDGAEPVIPVDATTGTTSIYAVRFGLDAFHGVATTGPLVQQWEPDWTTPGAVKQGEAEMGPVATVLKRTRAAAVLRNVKVREVAA